MNEAKPGDLTIDKLLAAMQQLEMNAPPEVNIATTVRAEPGNPLKFVLEDRIVYLVHPAELRAFKQRDARTAWSVASGLVNVFGGIRVIDLDDPNAPGRTKLLDRMVEGCGVRLLGTADADNGRKGPDRKTPSL